MMTRYGLEPCPIIHFSSVQSRSTAWQCLMRSCLALVLLDVKPASLFR